MAIRTTTRAPTARDYFLAAGGGVKPWFSQLADPALDTFAKRAADETALQMKIAAGEPGRTVQRERMAQTERIHKEDRRATTELKLAIQAANDAWRVKSLGSRVSEKQKDRASREKIAARKEGRSDEEKRKDRAANALKNKFLIQFKKNEAAAMAELEALSESNPDLFSRIKSLSLRTPTQKPARLTQREESEAKIAGYKKSKETPEQERMMAFFMGTGQADQRNLVEVERLERLKAAELAAELAKLSLEQRKAFNYWIGINPNANANGELLSTVKTASPKWIKQYANQ